MTERTSYEPGPRAGSTSRRPHQDALRFYGGRFESQLEDAGEDARHHHQALLAGKRIAGIGPAQPGGPPAAFWTTYLSGSDVEAHAAAIKDAGKDR
jgi:predicted enzyme related to lactoylglutathione lyase